MRSRHGCLIISQSKKTPAADESTPAGTLVPATSLHNTRLSAVVALFCPVAPRTRQRPSVPILVPAVSCGTAGRPQRWAHPWSTNIQPYFVILFSLVFFACHR